MLTHPRLPGVSPIKQDGSEPRPQLIEAAKPHAAAAARTGATGLKRAARGFLWLDMRLAAALGVGTVWASRKASMAGRAGAHIIPLVALAVVMVLLKAVWNVLLVPFKHVALAVVAAGLVIEGLLIGRLVTQLMYKEDIDGYAGTLLSVTDTLVKPFRDLEGTAILHDTGVVEFATLTAMEFYLVATIVIVLALTFWSEFLHMYRRVRDFFIARSAHNEAKRRAAQPEAEPVAIVETPAVTPAAPAADLSAVS